MNLMVKTIPNISKNRNIVNPESVFRYQNSTINSLWCYVWFVEKEFKEKFKKKHVAYSIYGIKFIYFRLSLFFFFHYNDNIFLFSKILSILRIIWTKNHMQVCWGLVTQASRPWCLLVFSKLFYGFILETQNSKYFKRTR